MTKYAIENPSRHTVADVLRRTAKCAPNRAGIICGATTWTYVQFDDICSRVATALAGHGIKNGDYLGRKSDRGFYAFQ